MKRMRERAAALCLLALCLLGLAACGSGDEMTIVGEITALGQREAVIRPLSPDEREGVPYRKELEGVKSIAFSTEVIDNFGAAEGDIVTILYRGKLPAGERDTIWLEVLSWAPHSPSE